MSCFFQMHFPTWQWCIFRELCDHLGLYRHGCPVTALALPTNVCNQIHVGKISCRENCSQKGNKAAREVCGKKTPPAHSLYFSIFDWFLRSTHQTPHLRRHWFMWQIQYLTPHLKTNKPYCSIPLKIIFIFGMWFKLGLYSIIYNLNSHLNQ